MKFVKSLLAVSIISVSAGTIAGEKADAFNDIMTHAGKDARIEVTPVGATITYNHPDAPVAVVKQIGDGTELAAGLKDVSRENSSKRRAQRQSDRNNQIPTIPEAGIPELEKPIVLDPTDPIVITPIDPGFGAEPIKEQPHVDAIKTYVADHGEAARQATTDLDSRIAANDSRIGKNADAIDFNRQAINSLQEEVNRLDDKMDGVMASTHAVTNARPFLTGAGQTAVGVGTGFAGDSQAVAIGVAHSFNTNWSASMSVNATTGSDSDFSAGAGVQYVF